MDGEKLRRLREERGMSVFDLACETHVTTGSIHAIESGQTKDPRVDTVRRLARALECDIGDLLGDGE